MRGIYYLFIFLLSTFSVLAQEDSTLIINELRDSLQLTLDSIPQDSMGTSFGKITLSPDRPTDIIEYGGMDSQRLDNQNRIVHLYGEAYVRYTNLSLTAGYIQLDLKNNIALAEGIPDSLGTLSQIPHFKEGGQEFESARMKYNFQDRKGLIYDVSTMENDLHIHGVQSKFYGEGGEGRKNHLVYSSDVIFTTCDDPEPHFGIRSKKQKIVPGKVAVVGASNLEIAGVPTPLWLPFGFFPLKQGRRSGLIFPREYEYSQRWGFGLNNVGYYIPINDYLGATIMTDIYFRGSLNSTGRLEYKKNHKYAGNLTLGYSRFKEEIVVPRSAGGSELDDLITKSFSINLYHAQDPNAHPTRTYGGSINIQTNDYRALNFNDYRNTFQNQLTSNFNITQIVSGTPFTATAAFRHSQNTNTREMNMTLPEFTLKMRQTNPFKKKKRVGEEKWFEKITLSYNASLKYQLEGIDSTFFEAETFENGRFGVQHRMSSSLPFNVLKYFKVSPNISLDETWYTKSSDQSYIYNTTIDTSTGETIITDSLVTNRFKDFNAIHEWSAGINVNTSIFSTLQLQKGWFRGLRYTMKPSVSLNYTPDYTDPSSGYFQTLIRENQFTDNDTSLVSKFQNEIFGGPGSGGERFGLNYSLTNIFEGKFFNKSDSSFSKVKLFNNIQAGGSYNFLADSLEWSPISLSGTARFFNNMTVFKVSGSWDPYAVNEKGRRINTFYKDSNNKLLRFVRLSFNFNTNFTLERFVDLFKKNKKSINTGRTSSSKKSKSASVKPDGLFSIFKSINFSHTFNVAMTKDAQGEFNWDPSVHNIAARGTIPISPKWNLTVGNISYDFVNKRTAFPDLSFRRDLHCWEMAMGWQPESGTYSFSLYVKPSSLDFIQLPYQRNRADGTFAR